MRATTADIKRSDAERKPAHAEVSKRIGQAAATSNRLPFITSLNESPNQVNRLLIGGSLVSIAGVREGGEERRW